jgi:DNA-directed RNA polymerase subunit RPC12/RpoP
MMMDVQVPCRKCGKKAPSSEFTIDPDLKMAVCKACANERKLARSSSGITPSVRNVPTELPRPEPRSPVLNHPGHSQEGLGITFRSPVKNTVSVAPQNKPIQNKQQSPPIGWDETDELIEKAAAQKAAKQDPSGNVRLQDGKIMHTCSKCKYQFKYVPEDDKPNKCPYCGTPSKGLFRQ